MAWVQTGTRRAFGNSSTATDHKSESKLEDLNLPASGERRNGSGAIETTEKWNRRLPEAKTLPDAKTTALEEKLKKFRDEERKLDITKSDFPLEKRLENTFKSIESLKKQLALQSKPSHTETNEFTGITSERKAWPTQREKDIKIELKRYKDILELQEKQLKLSEKIEKLGKK